ncbi:restriction endonuclease subunit S [Photobacterium damselae subsp. damselae]|uniref:Restriction endonuclease subunit S n=1 Tax=Photobacterium damselae subsp. damselae TaxID=85581 RepID=A0A850QP60_PHODD|nr:restriction endonuclease subunit S [Photobacterium damselae subsp. damselae]
MDNYPYFDMKESGVVWLPSIPKHWDMMKISHMALLKSGESITSVEMDTSGDYLVYGGNGIRGRFHEFTHEGDYVLIGRQGALCGNINYASGKFWASEHAIVVNPDRKVNTFWLGETLRVMNLGSLSTAAAQPGISVEVVNQQKLPFPPIEEQNKIASFIKWKSEKLNKLIEKKRAIIDRLKEKRLSIITQAVIKGIDGSVPTKDSKIDWLGEVPRHWDIRRLRFVVNSNPVKSEVKNKDSDTLVSFVPMDSVGEYGGVRLDTVKELGKVYDGYTYLAEDDVVVAKITPCFENGKGALVSGLVNGIGFGTTELHVLRAQANYSNRWLFYLTASYPFRQIGESEMYGAGGQKRVPESFIKNFRLGIPSFDEQEKIADFIDGKLEHVDRMLELNEIAITRLEEYLLTLIEATVTGQIDVRDIDIPEGY